MRKIVLILSLVGAALAAAGQALPSGSVLFGQNTWLAPDGSVWAGKDGYGYKRLLSPDDLTPYLNKATVTTQFVTPNVVFNGDVTISKPPTAATHAVNQGFLDAKLRPYFHKDTSAVQTIYSPTTFDLGTQVWVRRPPVHDNDATNKKYVDDAIAEIDVEGTDLGITGTTGARTITSSTGTGATIPVATTSVSGVMTPTDKNNINTALAMDLQDISENGNSTNRRLNITGAIGALTSSGMSLYSQQAPVGAGTSRTGMVSYQESGNLLSGVVLKDSLILTVITTTPHVQGEFKIFNNGSIPTTLFNGEMHAQEFYRTSTREIKKDIEPFAESALSVLNGVDVVQYHLKKGPQYKKIGFIAEDTHEYLSTPEHNVMDQGSSIGLLIKAVQELSAKVEELERRLSECQE